MRLLAATGLGVAIGLERQIYRHMAGLQTNTLVAAGSALFVLLAEQMSANESVPRVAAQIVSGIGFLGTGVILRDGLHVRGLNTAATLWCTAAVGTLCGTGHLREAFAGTLIVLFINTVLRRVATEIDRHETRAHQADFHYRLEAVLLASAEPVLRGELLQLLSLGKFDLKTVETDTLPDGRSRVAAEVAGPEQLEQSLTQLTNSFSRQPGVLSVKWQQSPEPGSAGKF